MRFLFGECVLELQARRLTRAGKVVPLAPKPLALLEHLLSRRPSVVPERQLRSLLWPETFVSYNSLAQVVSELRKAVGERGLIRTAYGVGYAFDGAAVEEHEPPLPSRGEAPGFHLVWGSRELALRQGPNVVGRGPDCECRIDSRRVSRAHARILVHGHQAQIEDLGSKNGTRLQGRPLDGSKPLANGDVILLGGEELVFRAVEVGETTETGGRSG